MIKSRYIINYFVLLLLLMSGSVYFSLDYPKETRILLIVSVLTLLLIQIVKNRLIFNKRSLFKLLVFALFISINFLFNIENGLKLNNLLYLIVLMTCVYIIKENVILENVKSSYIQVMKWLCFISIVCYFLSMIISPNIFPFYKEKLLGVDVFYYTFYHSWGWGVGSSRNSSLFWEPGAFQAYINLAILILVFEKDNIVNKRRYYIVFLIALLTTQSTTGYILTSVIILYAVFTSKIKIRSALIKMIVVILVLVGVIYISNSKVISDKFQEDNTSYIVRNKDLIESVEIIKQYPIQGVGYLSDKQYSILKEKDIAKNSNGLLNFIMQFGLLIFMVYICFLYKGIKSFFKASHPDTLFILMIFLVIFSTEPIVLYPIWIYFLFL